MTSLLVITADDLGIDPQRDNGIMVCFAHAGITQASLMVRGQSAVAAAHAARRVSLPLGLHLDLTETPPSASPTTVSSLLDASGQKLGKHGLRDALARGEIDPIHVERETRAQIARFEDLVGERPSHVDGHQHVHTIPALAEVLAPILASEAVRTTRIPEQTSVDVEDADAARFYRGVAEDAARSRLVYERLGISSTRAFVGLDLMGEASSPERLRDAVRKVLAAGSIELMCHPGYAGTSGDEFNRATAREHELRVLTSGPFGSFIAAGEIRLAAFRDVR